MAERLTPYLRRRVLDLPLVDRLALSEAIRVSLQDPTPDRSERLAYLADRMAEASGIDVRTTLDRTQRTAWVRAIFCFVARREGFPQMEIGAFIHRDHSSVCNAERRVNEAFALPSIYRAEIKLYNKFVESL